MQAQGIDHVEFYVADADQAAAELCATFGFRIHGELDRPGQRSVLVRQGGIQILFTTATAPDHPAADYVLRHGDGLATVALVSDDPAAAFADAVARGAVPVSAEQRRFTAFGDVAHTFVEAGELLTGYSAKGAPRDRHESLELLDVIDHIAACVPVGDLGPTTAFYREVLGFDEIFEEHIVVGTQAMNSRVVQSPDGLVTVTLLEPDPTGMPGQIDDFLERHAGAGVQHLALRTDDIATVVRTLSDRGVGFLGTPVSYYDELERRLGHVGLPVEVLRELNILVDRDEVGELFQIFTHTTHPRNTFFMEIIERLGALTFGSANIKALYQAVERERLGASPSAELSH
ncbi:4-hydroxyphenylpyruvate dioxygenase [Solihabitans fulvus]|uniref:4-hydroxyphenylpyruvate dioxygenase n=1 Tax=Solihabitans fulvus TaxID=1892852 RepID=A0A5B2X0I9_9PSEU|nr:4-hydroxyphenylpyruvate dioxygenase [Solihabitans fulvus]KAA2255897.1 4-hydroxyphenylpyruvate dioxygenase [Solihabitans fulvus]